MGQTSLYDTLNFENNSHQGRIYFDSTQSSGIWQIGRPQKALFDSAYSGNFAMITDTAQNYSASSSDTFSFGFEIYGSITTVEFKHRFDFDSLHAYGNIEISADSGVSWHLLHDTINSFNFLNQVSNNLGSYGTDLNNFYSMNDTTTNGINGFTGKSSGWVNSQIQFPCYAIKRPWEVYLRFNFIADSVAIPAEGWMIDDIMIYSYGGCGNLAESELTRKVDIFPNPSFGNEIKVSEPWEQTILYKVYSAAGQLVQSGNLPPFSQTIPLKFNEAGLYSFYFYSKQQPMGSALLQKP